MEMNYDVFKSVVACGIILFFGIILFSKFLSHNKKLKKIQKNIKKCFSTTEKEVNEASYNSINRRKVIEESENFDAIDNIRKEYNETNAKVNASVQLISMFPMMGLLGTVIGIIGSMKNLQVESLGFALWTTVVGLVCAMVLKYVAVSSSMKYMDEIEADLFESDRKYNMLISRGKISVANDTDVVEE